LNDPNQQNWSQAQDQADSTPDWTPDLPGGDFPMSFPYTTENPAGERQIWLRVHLHGGAIGGRWAYWFHKDTHLALADRIWNAEANHFIGMLAHPFSGTKGPAWVLLTPKAVPPPQTIDVEPEKTKGPRYERSKEVFDVDSQESRELP
jgi:hypothetical protein